MKKPILELSKNISYLQKELNSYIRKRMIVIFCKCSSLFDGRIKSTLEEEDRLLIIKSDETILLHNSSGVKPIQWQKPRAGRVNFTIVENKLQMETYRPKTDETFFITFSKIYHAIIFNTIELNKSSSIIGDEKDFITYLTNKPDLIEEGLRIHETEKVIAVGSIDIFAIDSSGNYMIIEVKKQSASPNDAHQLKRYVDNYIETSKIKTIRGILIAPQIPQKVQNQLKSYALESRVIHWQKIFPTIERPSSIYRTKMLDDYF